MLTGEDSALLQGALGSDKGEGEEEKEDTFTEEEMEEMRGDPEAADEDEEVAVQTNPASKGSHASESSKSRGPDVSSTGYGSHDRIVRAAEASPLVSQETPDGAVKGSESVQPQDASAKQEQSDDDAMDQPGAETSVQVDDSPATATKEYAPDPVGDSNQKRGDRELSPELSVHVRTSPVPVSSRLVEDDEDDATTAVQVDVVEPHSEDPNDPIESFSSVGDRERRDDPEAEDPIEDPDDPQPAVATDGQTPPPATPRTPGTVSRMKDRYGRLPQARAKDSAPPLSQQLLGDLALPEAELTLPTNMDVGHPKHDSVPDHGLEEEGAGASAERDVDEGHGVVHGDEDVVEPELEKAQDSRGSSQSQEDSDADVRPRRTTRVTRQTSTMPPPSTLALTTPVPTSAPPQRGRKRLSEEEKARREAEKQEKKAERERVAAAKKAEREAKAAAKRVETEARKAAKLAQKQAKDAAERALQEELVKRGARVARGRGRGRGAKPMSTRSQPSVVSGDEPEEEEGVEQPESKAEGPQASENIPETPATGKVSWAILSQSGPRTQTESVGDVESSMVEFDELQSSSPELAPERADRDRTKTSHKEDIVVNTSADEPIEGSLDIITPKPKRNKEPLFIPSSSQVPTRFGLPDAESTPFPDGDPHGDNSEVEDQETTLKGPLRSRSSWFAQAMYPTLSDLATQQLFPASQIPSPALFSQTPNSHASHKLVPARYGKGGEDESSDDDDDNSSSSDDEEAGKKSHIPQSRRAGAGVQKKKKSGLLSAYK